MQFGILPVLPGALTLQRRAAKVECAFVVLQHFDLTPDEQVLAFGAEPQLVQ